MQSREANLLGRNSGITNAMIFLEELGSGGGNPKANLVLGVKCDNRESVHGPKKVALTPNIGLDVLQQ